MFKNASRIIGSNPAMQFARKAARPEHQLYSNSTSPVATSLGLGQGLSSMKDTEHLKSVNNHRTFLNMMKFDMQQRSTI